MIQFTWLHISPQVLVAPSLQVISHLEPVWYKLINTFSFFNSKLGKMVQSLNTVYTSCINILYLCTHLFKKNIFVNKTYKSIVICTSLPKHFSY